MLSKVEIEKSKKKVVEITDLNLDDCLSNDGQLDDSIKELTSLQSLSLANVGLTTLKSFPELPSLQSLILSNNDLSGTLGCLSGCTALNKLNLSNTKIKSIDSLAPLANMLLLTDLYLANCEVTKSNNYRDEVFKLIPSLKYLDGCDKDGKKSVSNGAGGDTEANTGNGVETCTDTHKNNQGDGESAVICEKGQGSVDDSSVDANDVDSEEESEENEEEESEEESDEEIGLDYLTKGNIDDDDDEDDDGDYEEEEEEDDVEIVDGDEEESNQKGVKRKHEDNSD